jgi:hypothetical protein
MTKEKKTAEELAALIAEEINVNAGGVQVHSDPVLRMASDCLHTRRARE